MAADANRWKHIKAAAAPADDFSAVDKPVDLVLINSVAQYFPDARYFLDVITKSVRAIKPGGCLFIGDMQGMGSLEMCHTTDFLRRAPGDMTARRFMDVVNNRVRIEDEFTADPAFFYLLPKLVPGITAVDVQLRKGQALNETTRYHYDIWIYIGRKVDIVTPATSQDWSTIGDMVLLNNLLRDSGNKVVEITKVSNERTAETYQLLQLLADADPGEKLDALRMRMDKTFAAWHPDMFWKIAQENNYNAHVRWTSDGSDNMFDVVFIPISDKLVLPVQPKSVPVAGDIFEYARTPYTNNMVDVPADVTKGWQNDLASLLPAYMVPDEIVVLKKLPLTPNAKVDRKALPKPPARTKSGSGNTRKLSTAEQMVTSIWEDVLGMEGLSPDDDFFKLGGHSLLAVKVMVAIEKQTGKRLPIATLFNNSTIEKLARHLGDDSTITATAEQKWDALVPIQTSGNKPPVFLIHGAGMNVLLFKAVSEHLDPDQPVYGIQALGLSHKTEIPLTIEEISARYAKEILQVVPDGPYLFAGYSMGGFIAYEIARQLQARGKHVDFIGIMDTYVGNNEKVESRAGHLFNKIKRQFNKVPFYTRSFIENPVEALEYQKVVTQKRFRKLKEPGLIIPHDIYNDYETYIYKTYDNALNNYILAPLDVHVTLFRVEKRLYFLDDLVTLGWKKFALKGVKVCEVPGDHKTFLYPPHSKAFARILQNALSQVK